MPRTPVAVRGHSGGITVTILRLGPSGPFVHDMYADGRAERLHPSVGAAQEEADDVVRVVGHVCGERCTRWRLLD
jgi:hypothetical protein